MKITKNGIRRLLPLLTVLLLTALLFCSCSAGEKSADGGMENYYSKISGDESGLDVKMTSDSVVSRKLIKTYRVTAESTRYDDALAGLKNLISTYGGYVEKSDLSDNTYSSRRAEFTIRIPADSAEDFMNEVGGLLHLTNSSSGVEDVGEAYYDTEARLEELIAERDTLLSLMESLNEKEDYNFYLTLLERLSAVRQEIASYQKRLENYDSLIAYSTLYLTVREVVTETPTGEETFGSRIADAFRNSWADFGEGCKNFAVWFVGAVPTLLILGAIVFVIVLIVRRNLKKTESAQVKRNPPSDSDRQNPLPPQ